MKEFLEELKLEYSEKFSEFIERLIKHYSLTIDEIKESLPSPELIKMDQEHQESIGSIYVVFDYPVSFKLFEIYLTKDKELIYIPDYPTYFISKSEGTVIARFTKKQFLDSIGKSKKLEI